MTKEEFQQLSHTLPFLPGVYKYFDAQETLIYVGKAKSLRKRISSYFNKNLDNFKTRKLVEQIRRIEFTIVDTEQDAFLLENSLIKHFQPRYNISLKDDKTYPYIVIKKEHFPRVFFTRRRIKDGSEYIGPFTSVQDVRELMEFVRQYIPLRNCNLNLSPGNINSGKFKVCLEYHLGNCKGPCEGLQSEEDYRQSLHQLKDIMKGKLSDVIRQYKQQMQEYAANLEFEKAGVLKKKIDGLLDYQSRSVVVSNRVQDLDVATIESDEYNAYVNYMMVLNGAIVNSKTVKIEKKLDESDAEIIQFVLGNMRETFGSNAKEFVVPFEMDYPDENIQITVPKMGDKKNLLDLSLKNVVYFRLELQKKKVLMLNETSEVDKKKVLYQMKEDLQLPDLPLHIECFDNSNFQGSYPVSAMVCFKNGVPSKADYRHFNVKTVTGINDFASMSEAVLRRYKRLKEEGAPLPQLVIIDGGKGQLGAAMQSIRELDLVGKMTLVGLAKREEELFFPGDSESLKLPYDSPVLNLIRSIRDEVHRFGITFHRQKRSAGTFKNELEEIEGIGPKTADQLLNRFRSVTKIKGLTERELTGEIGAKKARIVYAHFHPGE